MVLSKKTCMTKLQSMSMSLSFTQLTKKMVQPDFFKQVTPETPHLAPPRCSLGPRWVAAPAASPPATAASVPGPESAGRSSGVDGKRPFWDGNYPFWKEFWNRFEDLDGFDLAEIDLTPLRFDDFVMVSLGIPKILLIYLSWTVNWFTSHLYNSASRRGRDGTEEFSLYLMTIEGMTLRNLANLAVL